MALSGDESVIRTDSVDSELEEETESIRKNLLAELDDEVESNIDGSMAPPPVPGMVEVNEKMQVYLRIRPLQEDERALGEDQGCVVVCDPTRVDMIAPKCSKTYEHSAHGCGKVINSFNFTKVYDEHTSQRSLFENCMFGTVKDFVDGQNCLVFAYGITNSGKTYTILGPPKDQGVIPRSLEVIFNSIGDKQNDSGADLKPQHYCEVKHTSESERSSAEKLKAMIISSASKSMLDASDMYSSSDSLASMSSVGESMLDGFDDNQIRMSINTECQGNVKFSIWVSFAEIYNEQIHDLLEPLSKSSIAQSKRKVMQLREDKNGNPFIKDLRHINVTTADEAIKVLTFGQRNLQYACTKLNESSSRGHCIFTIKIIRVVDKLMPSRARISQLSFCDLAGSERYGRTGNTGDRLKEAANINTSLLILGRCIQSLRKNQIGKASKDMMVPFRESKLTRLFQTHFCGRGKALMLVNVSPAASSFDENIQALKFSAIAKQVRFVPEKVHPLPIKKTQMSLALEQEVDNGRISIPWASAEELAEFSKMDDLVEEEESEEIGCTTCIGYHQAIGKLREALIETSEKLKQEQKAKKQIESKLREEICQEMMQQITEIEKQHEEELAEERQRYEEAAEKKVHMVTSAIHKSVKRKRQEAEEEMVSMNIHQAQQVKLENRETEIEDLQSKLQKTNEMLFELRKRSEEVRNPLSDLENNRNVIEGLQTELTQAHKEITDLKLHEAEFDEMKAKLVKAESEFSILKQKEVELGNLRIELEQANKVLSVLTQKETEKGSELKKATETRDTQNDALIESLRAELRKVEDKLSGQKQNEADVSRLEREREEAAAERLTIMTQKDAEITSLHVELSAANAERSCLKQMEVEVTNLRSKLAVASEGLLCLKQKETELERLQTELAQANEELSCLKDREADVINLRAEEALSKLEQKAKEYEELQTELRATKQSLAELETHIHEEREANRMAREQEQKASDMHSENITNMEGEMEKLQSTASDGELKLCDLKSQIASMKADHQLKIKDLELEVVAVSRGLQTSDREKEEVQKRVKQLELEQQENAVQLDYFQAEAEQLKLQVAERTKEYDSLVTEMGQLKETMSNLSDTTVNSEEMEARCNSLTTNMKKLQDQLRRRSVELHGDMSTVQTQLLATSKELERVKKERDCLSKTTTEYEGEVRRMRSESSVHSEELERVTEQLSQFTEQYQITSLKSKSSEQLVDNLKQQIIELREECKCKGQESLELKDEVTNLQTAIKENEARCAMLSAIAQKVKDVDRTLDEQTALHEIATCKITELSNENSALRKQLADKESQHASIAVLGQQVKTLEEDALSKEKKAASLQVILEARQSEWERKDSSHESLKQQFEELEKDLRTDNSHLQKELSELNAQLLAAEEKMTSKSLAHLAHEKALSNKVSDLERQVSDLKEQLKTAKRLSELRNPESATDIAVIEGLKSAVSEQEATMKVQDEVIESKEDQIHKLTKEICDWRLKCQDLCDIELEKTSLSSKLSSVTKEKIYLQDAQAKMLLQMNSLNQTTAALEDDIHRLQTENRELQGRIEEGLAATERTSDLEEKDVEILNLKQEMAEWQTNKEALVGELEKVLKEKNETIKRLKAATGNMDEDLSQKVIKLEERVSRKDKIILQLEHKIRSQESTLHDLVVGSGRTSRTRSATSTNSVSAELQSIEADLRLEQAQHAQTQAALDRVHIAKDEQVADLKEMNVKLQNEIERLEQEIHYKTPARSSDRFKEPNFTNDNELSGSTLELDVTPMSTKKKSAIKPARRSSRTNVARSSQKENTAPSSSRPSTFKRLQNMVEKSTSPLASPVLRPRPAKPSVKKLLNVRITPLKDAENLLNASNSGSHSTVTAPEKNEAPKAQTRRRRKLYTLEENPFTTSNTPPNQEDGSSSKRTRSNVHSIVSHNLRNMQPK